MLNKEQRTLIDLVVEAKSYSKGTVILSTKYGEFKHTVQASLPREKAIEKAEKAFFKLESKFEVLYIIPNWVREDYLNLQD